jgi:hypothetical protein
MTSLLSVATRLDSQRVDWMVAVLGGELAVPCTRNPQ